MKCEKLKVNTHRHKGHTYKALLEAHTYTHRCMYREKYKGCTCLCSLLSVSFLLSSFFALLSWNLYRCFSFCLKPLPPSTFASPLPLLPLSLSPLQVVQCGPGDDNQRRWLWRPVWRQTWGVWRQGPPSLPRAKTPSPCLWSSQWVSTELFLGL